MADFFNSYNPYKKYNVQLVILLIKNPVSREIIFIKIPGFLFLITEAKW